MIGTFSIRKGARVEAVIDGAHLYNVARNLAFEVDYDALRTILAEEYDLRRISYHIRVAYTDEGEIQSAHLAKLLDFLSFNGFDTHIGETKDWTNHSGQRVIRQSVDVAVACSLIEASRRADEVILFAGSEDLVPAVVLAQANGARVTCVSSAESTYEMISRELRRQAAGFVEIGNIRSQFTRRLREPVGLAQTAQTATVIEDRREAALGSRMRVTRSPIRA